jgi:ParB family chromosome partitioning protein
VRAPREGEPVVERSGVRDIDIVRIRPNPNQPRQHFDEAALDELAQSIADKGVLQPILLRPAGDGFEIIAGERRWRAAQKAQLHQIPALIRELDDATTAEVALIENIQRSDLNAIEEADAYKQLILKYSHSQDEVGRLVGKVAQPRRKPASLARPARGRARAAAARDISMGHARAVQRRRTPPRSPHRSFAMGFPCVRSSSSPRRQAVKATTRDAVARPVDADLAALERQLGDLLGLRVKVAHGKGGGTVALHYSSPRPARHDLPAPVGEPI